MTSAQEGFRAPEILAAGTRHRNLPIARILLPQKLRYPRKIHRWKMKCPFEMVPFQMTSEFFGGYFCGGFPVDILTKTDSFLEGLDLAVVYLKNYSLDKAQAKDFSISQ